MYLKLKITLGILVCVLLQSSLVFAATSPVDPVAGGVVVADVSIKNAGILSQQNNKVMIGFDLVNGAGIQSGVHYGIVLASEDGATIADETVYEESLILSADSSIHRDIVYTAPSVLSGSYNIFLETKNENNLPLDMTQLGTVQLVVGIHGVYADPSTCSSQIVGDTSGKRYAAGDHPNIASDGGIRLTCTILNQTQNPVTVTPTIETHYYSQFGSIVPGVGLTGTAISLDPSSQKTISFIVPTATKAQLYSAKVSFPGTNIPSNNVYIGYVVDGVQGSVQQVTLDKQSYTKGESGTLSLVWSAVARTAGKTNGAPGVSIAATITSNGTACIAPINQALVRDPKTGLSTIPFIVTKNCKEPSVSITLTDMKGTVLDEKTAGFAPVQKPGLISRTTGIIVIVILLVIAAVGIVLMRKKHQVAVITQE